MFQSAQIELARLEHHHGGTEWHEMFEVDAHDAAESDPERAWSRGRIFRCSTCADEIRVVTPDPSPIEGAQTSPFEGGRR